MGQNQGNVCIQNTQGGSLFGACGRQDNCPTPPPITPTPTPTATPTPTPTATPCPNDSICITVTDIPSADACASNLRAVVFQDFNSRHSAPSNANDIAVSTCNPDGAGNLSCEGQINVGAGALNQTVYVYCDTSTAASAYDRNGSPPITTQNYTNLQQLNICPRAMNIGSPGSPTSYTLTSPPDNFYANTTVTPVLTEPFGGSTDTSATTITTPGDRFNAAMENAGGNVTFTVADLVVLPSAGSHPLGGNLQTWCNCILGENVRFAIITNVTYSLRFYTGGSPTAFYRGFFTDTDPTSTGPAGSCILP